jgi:hypothetical protein
MQELAQWSSFYSIVGSAAGTLIGLQFIAMTLIAERPGRLRAAPDAGAAFGTPTIVHFAYALFVSAVLRIPWQSITSPAAVWGAMGLGGVIYAAITTRRMQKQHVYQPVLEDWLFHSILPLAAYAALVATAIFADSQTDAALLGVGADVLLLLVIGIHNVWDATTYHIYNRKPEQGREESSAK